MDTNEKVVAVEARLDGKEVLRRLGKNWWFQVTWGEKKQPADPEFALFGEALGATPDTEVLCILSNNFAPSDGFTPDEVVEFSHSYPTTFVSLLFDEENEHVYLNGTRIGDICCCRSSIEWEANGKEGRNY
jgi:hypothetical protein